MMTVKTNTDAIIEAERLIIETRNRINADVRSITHLREVMDKFNQDYSKVSLEPVEIEVEEGSLERLDVSKPFNTGILAGDRIFQYPPK